MENMKYLIVLFAIALLSIVSCNYKPREEVKPHNDSIVDYSASQGKDSHIPEIRIGMTKKEVLASLNKIRSSNISFYHWESAGSSSKNGIYKYSKHAHAGYFLDDDKQLHVIYESQGDKSLPIPDDAKVVSFEIISRTDLTGLRKEIGEDLFPYVNLVHQSPKVNGQEFNPVSLIKAVNGLRVLGKERALEVLRCYYKLAGYSGMADTDFEKRQTYDLDERRLFLILRILFVRKDGNPKMPELGLGMPSFWPKEDDTNWPLFPLTLENDIPFMLINGYTLAGVPESPLSHIEYCEKYCTIREKPLQPADNPLVVVESLINSSERLKSLVFYEKRKNFFHFSTFDKYILRRQALRATKSAYPIKDKNLMFYLVYDNQWYQHLEEFNKLKVYWDSESNDYKIGN